MVTTIAPKVSKCLHCGASPPRHPLSTLPRKYANVYTGGGASPPSLLLVDDEEEDVDDDVMPVITIRYFLNSPFIEIDVEGKGDEDE